MFGNFQEPSESENNPDKLHKIQQIQLNILIFDKETKLLRSFDGKIKPWRKSV